jgi:hypothetical protein
MGRARTAEVAPPADDVLEQLAKQEAIELLSEA